MKLLLIAMIISVCGIAAPLTNEIPGAFTVSRRDSTGMYLLSYLDRRPGLVTISVRDHSGSLVARRHVQNRTGFRLPLNMMDAREGAYTIQAEFELESRKVAIDYNTHTAPTYTTVVNLGDNRYCLTSRHNGMETITIEIIDGKGELIFQENRQVNGFFSTIFVINKVYGVPSFRITEPSGRSVMTPENPEVTLGLEPARF